MVFIPFPGQHLSGHRGTGVIRQRRHPGPFQGFFRNSPGYPDRRIPSRSAGFFFCPGLRPDPGPEPAKDFLRDHPLHSGLPNAGGRLQLSHIHNSYEYVPAGETPSLKLDLNTLKFVRSLILKQHSGKELAVRSGNQTIFVDPYTVLYVQSQNKRTELVCADQVISCNSSLSDLARELPDIFYPLHRGYYVNTLYITAIRRFEAELISGAVLPIPALNYTKIRDDLLDRIQIKP